MREIRMLRAMRRGLETWPGEPDCGPRRKPRISHRTLQRARHAVGQEESSRVASGVYFVRVATPYEVATVKIVMVE